MIDGDWGQGQGQVMIQLLVQGHGHQLWALFQPPAAARGHFEDLIGHPGQIFVMMLALPEWLWGFFHSSSPSL